MCDAAQLRDRKIASTDLWLQACRTSDLSSAVKESGTVGRCGEELTRLGRAMGAAAGVRADSVAAGTGMAMPIGGSASGATTTGSGGTSGAVARGSRSASGAAATGSSMTATAAWQRLTAQRKRSPLRLPKPAEHSPRGVVAVVSLSLSLYQQATHGNSMDEDWRQPQSKGDRSCV